MKYVNFVSLADIWNVWSWSWKSIAAKQTGLRRAQKGICRIHPNVKAVQVWGLNFKNKAKNLLKVPKSHVNCLLTLFRCLRVQRNTGF